MMMLSRSSLGTASSTVATAATTSAVTVSPVTARAGREDRDEAGEAALERGAGNDLDAAKGAAHEARYSVAEGQRVDGEKGRRGRIEQEREHRADPERHGTRDEPAAIARSRSHDGHRGHEHDRAAVQPGVFRAGVEQHAHSQDCERWKRPDTVAILGTKAISMCSDLRTSSPPKILERSGARRCR